MSGPWQYSPYPNADATSPESLPEAIRATIEDPTGCKNRDQLLACAEEFGIEGCLLMTRAQLATALNAAVSRDELTDALYRLARAKPVF